MSKLDDVRKSVSSTVGSMTPAKAREMAKDLLEPGAAKERIDRVASDLVGWSQRNTERVRELVRREISDQLGRAGLAKQSDLDAVKKRLRALERQLASGKRSSAKKPAAKKTTARSGGASAGGGSGT